MVERTEYAYPVFDIVQVALLLRRLTLEMFVDAGQAFRNSERTSPWAISHQQPGERCTDWDSVSDGRPLIDETAVRPDDHATDQHIIRTVRDAPGPSVAGDLSSGGQFGRISEKPVRRRLKDCTDISSRGRVSD